MTHYHPDSPCSMSSPSTPSSVSNDGDESVISSEDVSSHYSSRADSIWGTNKYDTTPEPRSAVKQVLKGYMTEDEALDIERCIFDLSVRVSRVSIVETNNTFFEFTDVFRKFYTEVAYSAIMVLQHFDFDQEHVSNICDELRQDKTGWDSYLFAEYHYREKVMLNELATPIEMEQGIHECSGCKRAGRESLKTISQDIQTRSADEPMTTFVSCTECGNQWRIN